MMNLQTLSHRLLASLVGTAVGALGCSHPGSNSLNNATASAPVRRSTAVAYQYDRNGRPLSTATLQPAIAPQASRAPLVYEPVTVQGPAMLPAESPRVDQAAPPDSPRVIQEVRVMSPGDADTGIPRAADPEGVVQSINRKAIEPDDSFHNRQNPAPRRSFVDLTAQPWFSHATDYSWLAGELHFKKSETCWRLRYASLDENDPYDGEVTITGYPSMEHLKEGQYVRVHGYLVDPAKKELGSTYKVSSLQPIQKTSDTIAGGEHSGETNTSLSK